MRCSNDTACKTTQIGLFDDKPNYLWFEKLKASKSELILFFIDLNYILWEPLSFIHSITSLRSGLALLGCGDGCRLHLIFPSFISIECLI